MWFSSIEIVNLHWLSRINKKESLAFAAMVR